MIEGLAPDRTAVTHLRQALSASLPKTEVVLRVRSLEDAIVALKSKADTRRLPADEEALVQLERWLDRQAVRFGDDASLADPSRASELERNR